MDTTQSKGTTMATFEHGGSVWYVDATTDRLVRDTRGPGAGIATVEIADAPAEVLEALGLDADA